MYFPEYLGRDKKRTNIQIIPIHKSWNLRETAVSFWHRMTPKLLFMLPVNTALFSQYLLQVCPYPSPCLHLPHRKCKPLGPVSHFVHASSCYWSLLWTHSWLPRCWFSIRSGVGEILVWGLLQPYRDLGCGLRKVHSSIRAQGLGKLRGVGKPWLRRSNIKAAFMTSTDFFFN